MRYNCYTVFMKFDWDETKSLLLQKTRGFSFDDVKEMFRFQVVEAPRSTGEAQFMAIGFVQDQLITLIYEMREDENEDVYFWLVTYWKSTKAERAMYEQKIQGANN